MIDNAILATLRLRRIIFHDIPKNVKGAGGKPDLADSETPIDPVRAKVLKDRLVGVLGSRAAYSIEFPSPAAGIVPAHVENYTSHQVTAARFIKTSQALAQNLFDMQTGSNSPGLLCVIDLVSGGRAGVALLKLERERGIELEWQNQAGLRLVEMSVLDNLVLTDGTRLFKSALFLKDGTSFDAVACDSQLSVHSSADMAQFWLRFLGCKLSEEPRVTTQRWFDATIQFVNDHISSPVEKTAIYEHAVSELNSNRSVVSARKFAADYVSVGDNKTYLDFMKEKNVSLQQFTKDTTDLASKLRRTSYHTINGVTVTAPAESEGLVAVGAEEIVVHDQLKRISK